MTREKKVKELTNKYPFMKVKDQEKSNTWTYSWLDDLEPGWLEAFGEELCQELAAALKEDGCEDDFEFLQIKEKYASLRLYAARYGEKTKDVLAKYEELSKYICGHCGKPATKITRGWYYPLCDTCIEDVQGGYSPIENYYGFESYEEIQKEIEKIKTDYAYGEYWVTV